MAIYPADIRTQLPVVEGQFPESGGRPGPNELVHNEVGLLFPKLTEIAHAGGQVDLSKLYQWIKSPNTDLAAKSYTFIDTPPSDPLVSCALFRANPIGSRADHTNTRADLQSYVESYQIAGGLAPWFLRGNHPAGIDTLFLWAHESVRQPEVGQVLYLVYDEGGGGERSQYVQVIGVTVTTETFQEWVSGALLTFERKIYACSLSQPLGDQYVGPEVSYVPPIDQDVLVRECVVAEAARYYGTASVTQAATAGATSVQVDSVYTQITPVARGEQGLADVVALSAGAQTIASGGVDFTVYGPVHTHSDEVTAATRKKIWSYTMSPIPATGGLVHVHVRILDRWYEIVETEDSPVGAVTVNRLTGTGTLSLVDLPDADTWLLWEWPAAVHYTDRSGIISPDPVTIRGTLTTPVEPATLSFAWTSGGAAKTATAAVDGSISGHASGRVLPTGEWWLDLTANLPDYGTQIDLQWTDASEVQDIFDPITESGGSVSETLSQLPQAGSVTFEWETQQQTERISGYDYPAKVVKTGILGGSRTWTTAASAGEWGSSEKRTIEYHTADDGAGNIIAGGAITYATGAFSLDVVGDYDYKRWNETLNTWESDTGTETFRGRVVARYQTATGGTVHNESIDIEPIRIRPLAGLQDSLIPGTLRFTFGGIAYSDRNGQGILYLADGQQVGSVNYIDGEITVTQWSGTSLVVNITSAISTFGQWTQTSFQFRTAAAPLATASLQVNATDSAGNLVQGDCDASGVITGTGISAGTCEQDIGFVTIAYANSVWSGSILYNATAYTIVPLDPAIIGIDPVRLPQDGRVIGLRSGDYLALYHDETVNAPNPLSPSGTIDLGETDVAWAVIEDGAGEESVALPAGIVGGQVVDLHTLFSAPKSSRTGPLEYAVLEDAEGKYVSGELYSADFGTWEITFADPLSLADYVEPLTAKLKVLVSPDDYEIDLSTGIITMDAAWDKTGLTEPLKVAWRYQDVVLCAEAQTTGELTLLTPLAHDYAIGDGISSLLQHGDLQARVINVFSENTIPAQWADYLQGSAPSGGANFDPEYVVTRNDGAIRERWRIKRRSDGQFDIIGETRGGIGIWDGASDLDVYEYAWQEHPYFTLYVAGLGTGWATGNFFQFETYAAQAPFAVLRCVKPGAATVDLDSIRLRHRLGGD